MELKGKNIVVLGAGVAGRGAAALVTRRGAGSVQILGRPEEGVPDGEGAAAEKFLEGADLLVKSPGIPWSHSLLKKAASGGVEIVGEADLACASIDIPIIAVTGTNGKTTTVMWLEEAFRRAGIEAGLGGNIGVPVSDLVEASSEWEVLILELSSFQLEGVRYLHPEIGVVLNISESHAERYRCFEDYRAAKAGIATNMVGADLLLLPGDNSFWPGDVPCRIEKVADSALSFERFALKGKHHRTNAAFCAKVLEEFARRHDRDAERLLGGMQEVLDNFQGIPHRVERVESKLVGVRIYNDSKSTNWQSVVAALESLGDAPAPFFLILGGALRGGAQPIKREFLAALEKRVDGLFLYGEAGESLVERIATPIPCRYRPSLGELCREMRGQGGFKTLLFSPGFPSFDQFPNYQARGDAFKEAFSL